MNEATQYDIAIIGGGLAGLSLAIQSADKGYNVVLFEKEKYPFHKVCGEYISLESWEFLERLGVPLSEWKLPVIKKFQTSDSNGKIYNFNLPLGGFGISRYKLDNELYKIALQKGVAVYTETKVSDVSFSNQVFQIKTSKGSYTSVVATGSFGKRSNLDVKLKRPFIQQKPNKLNNYIGIKYHVKSTHAPDTIALHNFRNGYCGISKIENDVSCLCYLTTANNLELNSSSIAEMERKVLHKNPTLKNIFENGEFVYDQPLAISQISFSEKTQIENHMLMIGDAAGMIPPLCGNGMSMAMHGSKLAFDAIDLFLQKKTDRTQMEKAYAGNWQKEFGKRLFAGRIVQKIFGGNFSTSLFLKTMDALPSIANRVIASTHGKSF